MTAKDDRKNAEGYNDPTAYNAIKNVEQEQDKDDVRFHQLLNMLFSLCELADFHIEGRVVLKDKRTGNLRGGGGAGLSGTDTKKGTSVSLLSDHR